jgi:hypothetical protein
MSIFWILYLFIKNTKQEADETLDTLESTKLLYSLFRFVFGEVLTQLPIG